MTPFLLAHAVQRETGHALPGRYSEDMDMWMIVGTEGDAPAIEAAPLATELETKTKVDQETDDDRFLFASSLLETKTAANVETDDDRVAGLAALLTTKTDAQLEQDDERPTLL